MKKVLCITMMALMAMAVAQAEEGSHEVSQIGVGLRAIMFPQGDIMPAATIRWAPAPLGGEILIGQLTDNTDGGDEVSMLSLAGKVLYSLIERENSAFYVGGELGMDKYELTNSGTTFWDETAISFGGLVGSEWRFSELPELGFNFEVGYYFSSWEDDASSPSAEGDHSGIVVSVGSTYYF